MPVTRDEIDEFHQFATTRIESGTVESFDDLYVEWNSSRERGDVNADIARGLADVEAGRFSPAAVVVARLSQEFGFTVR